MPEKRGEKAHYSEEGIGIAGFTLGILSILSMSMGGIVTGIVGFCLCLYQQKKNPTKLGKIGIYLNVIGLILGILFTIIFLKYLIPILAEMQSSQTFPGA